MTSEKSFFFFKKKNKSLGPLPSFTFFALVFYLELLIENNRVRLSPMDLDILSIIKQ